VTIVTTASLPWATGTAVNPLLRAAYLQARRMELSAGTALPVTLMIPFLERPEDRERVFGSSETLQTRESQREYVENWLTNTASLPPSVSSSLRLSFYPAWQNVAENSVYSMGDLTELVPPQTSICILEEPVRDQGELRGLGPSEGLGEERRSGPRA
jgi:digalactosyldiacylglycerol synthase